MNKRGIGFSVISSLILGILLLVIVFIWINETGQDSDWDVCRNSIIIRNTIPEISLSETIPLTSFKDSYPLNCKTQVVTINYNDTKKAQKEIMDTIASCWYLINRGEASIFPSKLLRATTSCFTCARIHFTPDVREYYSYSENKINLKRALLSEIQPQISYMAYLTNDGNNPFLKYSITHPVTEQEWWNSDSSLDSYLDNSFKVIQDKPKKENWLDKLNPLYNYFNRLGGTIILPQEIDPYQGFYITISSWIINADTVFNNLLFYHYNDIDQLSNTIFLPEEGGTTATTYSVCDNWDGIPA